MLFRSWDKAHDAGSHLWLTGSPPDEVFTRLGVQKWLSDANIKVLDVGVGEGLMAKRLREMDICFDCLDISPIALNKVRNLCRAVFLEAENLPSSEYSLIMHHLVAQHMDDSELRRQIMHLVRSLRPGGAIALQFAAPIGVEERSATENSMSFEKIVTGGFLRSTGEISEIVRSAGGQVAALLPREQWSRSSCQFWVAHIGRDDSDAAAND